MNRRTDFCVLPIADELRGFRWEINMKLRQCPECGEALEAGWVNAPSWGMYWLKIPRRLVWVWQLRDGTVEPLQRDWWGFPKLTKDNIPAQRCRQCNLVLFHAPPKQD